VRTTPGRGHFYKGTTKGGHDIVVMQQESATNARGDIRAQYNNGKA